MLALLVKTPLILYNVPIMSDNIPQPFSAFGHALKKLRESYSKSQIELSGAVEVDLSKLVDFELGKARPTEDVLLLIIQHFDLADSAAGELWRLAGYESTFEDGQYFVNDDEGMPKQTKTVMISREDARIVYTDMVQVMVNNFGVIINFLQGAGPNNQPLAVSRIGMSKEHAKSVLEVLKKTLEQSDTVQTTEKIPKQLPASTKKQD